MLVYAGVVLLVYADVVLLEHAGVVCRCLMKRAVEARRQRESVRTQQEWKREKRKREEEEATEGRACKRPACRPGGKFPPGLTGKVAAAIVDRSRAEGERIIRKQVVQKAMAEGERAGVVTEGGDTAGVVVDQEEERMVWAALGGDGSAPPGGELMSGLEEMGMQVEVDGAYGKAHLSTELRRLGKEPGYRGVVMHGGGTGKAVVAWVLKKGRRRARRRVFDATVMVVRHEHRGRGLARQAMQMVQTRLGEEVQEGSYNLRAGLKSCMQREGVGLYRALGWRGDGESWEWSSDEHAAQETTRSPGNLTESGQKKERKSAARCRVGDREDMPMRETGDEVGQDASEQGDTQGAGVDPLDTSIRARQLRLNEQGGKQCICGRWEDFARVDGG